MQRAERLAGGHALHAEREVTVYAFDERGHDGDRLALHVECSSGTYIRSLVADLGDAYTEELRRTAIGPFHVDDADPERIMPLGDVVGFFRSVTVAPDVARRVAHGQLVEAGVVPEPPAAGWELPEPPPEVLVRDADGPVALAELLEDGRLKPVVGFRA